MAQYLYGTHALAFGQAEGLKSIVWKALVLGLAPSIGAMPEFVYGQPQHYVDPAPQVFEAAASALPGSAFSWWLEFGSHARAIEDAEGLKTALWKARVAGSVAAASAVPAAIHVDPQADPTQYAFFQESVRTPPAAPVLIIRALSALDVPTGSNQYGSLVQRAVPTPPPAPIIRPLLALDIPTGSNQYGSFVQRSVPTPPALPTFVMRPLAALDIPTGSNQYGSFVQQAVLTPPPPAAVMRALYGSEPPSDTTQQARLARSAITQPPAGKLGRFLTGVQQDYDFVQQASWFEPFVLFVPPAGGGNQVIRQHRWVQTGLGKH